MIWKAAATHSRVVIVDHAYQKHKRVSRKNIVEKYPGMLGACRESRHIVIAKYWSVFGQPNFTMKWVYAGPATYDELYLAATSLFAVDFKDLRTPRHLTRAINKFMNKHQEQAYIFEDFAERIKKHKGHNGIIMPAFFNAENDVLYYRKDTGASGHGIQVFRPGLWSPKPKLGTPLIQKMAMELDRLRCCDKNEPYRYWSRIVPSNVPGLEAFSLVLMEDREVITFTADDTGKLQGREWAFSLDLRSNEFEEEMGEKWLGVTWRVTLADHPQLNLMQLAYYWRPHYEIWEWQKQEICKGEVGVKEDWHETLRVPNFDYDQWKRGGVKRGRRKKDHKLELLRGGDGKTYYGVSRK